MIMDKIDSKLNVVFAWLLRIAGFVCVILLILWLAKIAVSIGVDIVRMLGF